MKQLSWHKHKIARSTRFYPAHYTTALAYAALALLEDGSELREENERRASAAFDKSAEICGVAGVIQDFNSLFNELLKVDDKGILPYIRGAVPVAASRSAKGV
jgi:hypothetical protein